MIGLLLYPSLLKGVASSAFVIITTPSAFLVWNLWRLVTYPFPNRLFSWGDEYFYSLYQRMILFLAEEITGVEIYFYGEIEKINQENKKSLVLFNHQCTVDWLMASSLGLRQGSVGSVRYILKHSLFYIPFYGMYLKGHGCIYIQRKQFDSTSTVNQLRLFSTLYDKFWLIIFPEGTRYNNKSSEAFKKSQAYALSNGLPTFDHVLVPHVRGFETCLRTLGPKLHAIYDVTVAYKCFTYDSDLSSKSRRIPSLIDLFNGECREVHIDVRYFDIKELLTNDNLQDWLIQRFDFKNKLLEKFHDRHELFDDQGIKSDLSITQTLPPFLLFLFLDALLLCTFKGQRMYALSLLAGCVISALSWTLKL